MSDAARDERRGALAEGALSKATRGSVLFVAPSAFPLGGVATWLDAVVPDLERLGWRATVALSAGRLHDPAAYLARHPLPRVETFRARSGSRESRVRTLVELLRRSAPDVALSVNLPDLFAAIDRLRASGRRAPRVAMTLHAIVPDYFDDLAFAAPILDAVVTSNRLACRLSEVLGGIEPHRVHYAPYGVDLDAVEHPERRAEGALRVGFCGRIDRDQKRVQDVAAIADELCRRSLDFELWIAGAGPDEAWLRARLAASPARDRVRWCGDVGGDWIGESFYRQLDALLVTSRWETGPIVAWEAMARGVPVVTSAYIGSGAEGALVDGENCRLFPCGDVTVATERLLAIVAPEARRRLAAGGRRLVAERYSRQHSAAAWDAALRAVLARQPRAPTAGRLEPDAAGRLDRWLGVQAAESVRSAIGLQHRHDDPGGEWPHTLAARSGARDEFWACAEAEDRPLSAGPR